MEFIYNGLIYFQRTQNSKFICKDLDGNILEKYTLETLPYEIYFEYMYIKMQIETPNKFFKLKDTLAENLIEISGIAHEVHNLIIPEFIDGKQVYDIDYNINSLVNVEYISIPNNFRRYPSALLSTASNLMKVYVGDNCQIDKGAFANKEKLIEVHIPESLTSIESACFYNCQQLKIINLRNINEFRDNSFSHCKSLNFKIPKNTIKIGEKAFFKSGITSLDLDGTIIENAAFAMCDKLTMVNIISEKVAENAFADCNNLK